MFAFGTTAERKNDHLHSTMDVAAWGMGMSRSRSVVLWSSHTL